MTDRRLSDAVQTGRENNLDALRLGAAVCVVVSHAWPLSLGAHTLQPLEAATGWTLGKWAVLVFFVLSGFLIARSAELRRQKPLAFWAARANRLLPALLVALPVTVILALLSGADPDALALLVYYVRGATLVSLEHQIAGAFAGNPLPFVVNGPLYTLFYEVLCYGFAFALVVLVKAQWRVPALLGAMMAVGCANATLDHLRLTVGTPFFLAFAWGALAYVLRDKIAVGPKHTMLAAGALVLFLWVGAPKEIVLPVLCYLALSVGYGLPALRLSGDLSYGTYLYGWPITQFLVHTFGPMTPASLAMAGIFATLPFAAFSWTLIENRRYFAPALTAKQGA